MTKAANNEAFVRSFQERAGLPVDGWAGPKTRDALDRLMPKPRQATPKWNLSERDLKRLECVDQRLVNVVKRAAEISERTFMVVEGLRTQERQRQLYAQGRTAPGPVVTWTMKSKHIEGRAVDLAPTAGSSIDWNDIEGFNAVSRAMLTAAAELGVHVRWGADWDGDGNPRERGETDSPHFEV